MAQLFLALGLILVIAKTTSYISLRLGQPSMVGALIAGVALGPGALGFYTWPVFTQDQSGTIAAIAELGFLLLVFGAGLELQLDDLFKWGRVVLFSGWLGVIVTMIAVPPLMLLAHYNLGIALFTAVTLAGTGNGVAAQIVLEMDMIRSKVGIALLYAAMIDDILIVLALSILVAFSAAGTVALADVAVIGARVTAFIIAAMLVGGAALPALAERVDALPIQSGAVVLAVASTLLLGWAAEALGGMAPISGAFIAGLCLGKPWGDDRPGLGWISTLAVRQDLRGRGLGGALLRHGLRRLQERDYSAAGLEVDSENGSNAAVLYERAGMTVHKRYLIYQKAIRRVTMTAHAG